MKPVPERQAAKAAGEQYYFTNKTCKNGHTSKRYTSSGICVECAHIDRRKYEAKKIEHPNRAAARLAGERHYFVDGLCQNGHENKRWVANGCCVQCAIAKTKRWNERNPGHQTEGTRRRRKADPTRHRAASRKWASKNMDKVIAKLKVWKQENKEHWNLYNAVYSQNRRALKSKNGGSYTPGDVITLTIKQDNKCAGCGLQKKLEVDHIVPVIKGGSNNPENLQLLCRKCNASKGAKDADEWFASIGKHLEAAE